MKDPGVAAQVKPSALWRSPSCGSSGSWGRGTSWLVRICELLAFTIHMQVKCKHFLSLRGNKGSNKLRRPQGKPQTISVCKTNAHGILIICLWLLPLSLQGRSALLHSSLLGASSSVCTCQVRCWAWHRKPTPSLYNEGANWFMSAEVEKMSKATKYDSPTLSFL